MSFLRILVLVLMIGSLTACETVDSVTSKVTGIFHEDEAVDEDVSDSEDSDAVETETAEAPPPIRTPQEDIVLSKPECPDVTIVGELSVLHQFKNPEAPAEKDRISSIKMADYDMFCEESDVGLTVTIRVDMEGRIGPKARIFENDRPSFSYPYFLAVITPDGEILSKDIYAHTVTYGRTNEEAMTTEVIERILSNKTKNAPEDHSILIGFQLDKNELAYNRSLMAE